MEDVTNFLYKYVMNNNPQIYEEDIDHYKALNKHDLLIVFKNGTQFIFDTFANTSHRVNTVDPTSDQDLRLGFKRKLQTIMARNWVSQDELAKRIGSTQPMISRYLTGQSIPSAITLKKMADALNCTTDEFYDNYF